MSFDAIDNLKITSSLDGGYNVARHNSGLVDGSGKPYGRYTDVGITIGVGEAPYALAYCPINSKMYVCNYGGPPTYSTINCTTNTASTPVAIAGTSAQFMAYCPTNNCMYFVRYSNVTVISCFSDLLVTTISLGDGYPACPIAYCPSNNCMYVIREATTAVIDCSTNTISATIGIGSFTDIAYYPTMDYMYLAAYGGSITIINCATNSTVRTVSTGLNIQSLAYCPTNNSMYTTNAFSNTVTPVNCSTDSVGPTIATGAYCSKVIYCPSNDSMYAVAGNAKAVYQVSCSSNTVITSYTYVLTHGPDNLAYCPVNNCIYVAFIGWDYVRVVSIL